MEVPARRRQTLSHQFSMIDSCNLRDLLKVREDEDEIRHGETTVTLATILACEKQRDLSFPSSTSIPTIPISSSSSTTTTTRTLLDIIRDEDDPRSLVIRGDHGGSQRISWKSFKDRLRLRRATAAWPNPSAGSTSTTITITHNHSEDRSPPSSLGGGEAIAIVEARTVAGNRPSSATHTPVPDAGRPSGSTGRRLPEQRLEEEPIRVSLMALLEQNDRMGNRSDNLQGTSTIATAMIGMVEEDDEVLEEEEERMAAAAAVDVSGGEKRKYVCCVCMVRHKGAAFIPCGHTFCRLCSRELWVSRGICPLCNGFILEILDIF